MTEWAIVLEPSGRNSPHGSITIAYLPDRESARIDAEGYAEMIEASGLIPPAFDVHPGNHIPCAIVRRQGRASWRVRTDAFEHETDNGYDEGYGWLRVREVLA